MNKLPPLQPTQRAKRHEWKRPGELIHVDTKKRGRIKRVGRRIHGDRTTRVRRAGCGLDNLPGLHT